MMKNNNKELKNEFLNSEKSLIYKKAHRIFVLGIVGVIFAIVSAIFEVIYSKLVINFVLDGLLLIFSFVFIIKTNGIKKQQLNKYLKEKKTEK